MIFSSGINRRESFDRRIFFSGRRFVFSNGTAFVHFTIYDTESTIKNDTTIRMGKYMANHTKIRYISFGRNFKTTVPTTAAKGTKIEIVPHGVCLL